MTRRKDRLWLLLPVLLYATVLVRTAWITDDAFLTLRTVDHFLAGRGLVWNVGERVQVYTHPLWMLMLAGVKAILHHPYYTNLGLSMLVSLLTVLLVARFGRGGVMAVGLGILSLTLSKAFMDYSTSGLENPLSHLLLTLFILLGTRGRVSNATIGWLALTAGLAGLTRLDTLLLYLPTILMLFIGRWSRRTLLLGFLGFSPLILWELFSLIYYGFPFPNTAYAKLSTGIPRVDLLEQGLLYGLDSLNRDPLTLLLIGSGAAVGLLRGRRLEKGIAVGVLLYGLYILWIGGDFMSGRFFTLPLMAAVLLLIPAWDWLRGNLLLLPFTLILVVGLTPDASPIRSGAGYGSRGFGRTFVNGIADERAVYYQGTGLLKQERNRGLPYHRWKELGLQTEGHGEVQVRQALGMIGYYADPDIHFIDTLGLADPLLARLPVKDPQDWRIGHFDRAVPEGYEQTVRDGEIFLKHQGLARYYEALSQVTQGELWSGQRFVEIWHLNTGYYRSLLRSYVEEVYWGEGS